jgi:hypothetical protein
MESLPYLCFLLQVPVDWMALLLRTREVPGSGTVPQTGRQCTTQVSTNLLAPRGQKSAWCLSLSFQILFNSSITNRTAIRHYSHVTECDYRRVLDWWADLLDTLIQGVTTLYISLLHTQSHLISRYSVAASNSGRSLSSGFPSCPRLLTATAHDWTPAVL